LAITDENDIESVFNHDELALKELSLQLSGCELVITLFSKGYFGSSVKLGSVSIGPNQLTDLCYHSNDTWVDLNEGLYFIISKRTLDYYHQ
jgi:hypothetical protein